ncbi:MAG: hypothetical protein R6X27_20365 [Candidatus Desulfacyla sp.]
MYCRTILSLCLAFMVVTSVAYAGSVDFTYDNAGRLTKADYGLDRSIAYTYDNNGNLLQRTVQGTATTYTLTVNSGTGSGQYEVSAKVNIAANPPAAGQIFDRWTGDTAYVASVTSASTFVTMPATNVTVTATYSGQQIVYVSADGTCGNNTPCYATLGEAVSKAENNALIKVAGNMAGNTVMDPAGTLHVEFGYDANFTSNAGGVTEIQGTFTAKDKTIIRSGTIRGR